MSESHPATELAFSPSAAVQSDSSAGMTTRVVRGSLWSIGGQGMTMLAMLVASPYIIRRLGAEVYGVLTLINVLIGYLGFSDIGMGLTATRFGADAHSRQDDDGEAAIVWTSLAIAFVPAAFGAAALAVFAGPVVEQVLRLPDHLQGTAVVALRLAALGFLARTVAGVINAPQLVRLRMDLNTLVVAGAGVTQNGLVAFALWMQGGLVGAVAAITGTAILSVIAHAGISHKLLPSISRPKVRGLLIKPLLRFGIGLVVSTVAGMVLINIEKLLLPRFASVSALAHYAVAYSVAGVLAFAPAAMKQSLLPAFSRLHAASERESLARLYTRALRGNLLWLAPAALVLCAGAKPFFTLWAGPEYGQESAIPFYILVGGLILNVMAYVPHTLLMAYGRSDLIARVHLGEVLPYALCAVALIHWFGAIGAALAWSLRVTIDALLFYLVARRITGFSFWPLPINWVSYTIAIAVLLLSFALVIKSITSLIVLAGIVLLSLIIYFGLVWGWVLSAEERAWVNRLARLHRPIDHTL